MSQPTNKPLSYIDRVIASEEFRQRAIKAEEHWDRYFRAIDPNPSFAQMIVLAQTIRRMLHEGERP